MHAAYRLAHPDKPGLINWVKDHALLFNIKRLALRKRIYDAFGMFEDHELSLQGFHGQVVKAMEHPVEDIIADYGRDIENRRSDSDSSTAIKLRQELSIIETPLTTALYWVTHNPDFSHDKVKAGLIKEERYVIARLEERKGFYRINEQE